MCSCAQMMTSAIYGCALTPAALADEKGNALLVQQCASPLWLERLLRPVLTAFRIVCRLSSLDALLQLPA